MEDGQSRLASSAHNSSGPNVSAVPRPTVARQASNQPIMYFLVRLKPALQQQQSRLVHLLMPPQQTYCCTGACRAPLSCPTSAAVQTQRLLTPSQQ